MSRKAASSVWQTHGARRRIPAAAPWAAWLNSRWKGPCFSAFGRWRNSERSKRKAKVERSPAQPPPGEEYLSALDAARRQGRRMAWLLMRVFGEMQLPQHALGELTVRAVRAGTLRATVNGRARVFAVPPAPAAGTAGLRSGPRHQKRPDLRQPQRQPHRAQPHCAGAAAGRRRAAKPGGHDLLPQPQPCARPPRRRHPRLGRRVLTRIKKQNDPSPHSARRRGGRGFVLFWERTCKRKARPVFCGQKWYTIKRKGRGDARCPGLHMT